MPPSSPPVQVSPLLLTHLRTLSLTLSLSLSLSHTHLRTLSHTLSLSLTHTYTLSRSLTLSLTYTLSRSPFPPFLQNVLISLGAIALFLSLSFFL